MTTPLSALRAVPWNSYRFWMIVSGFIVALVALVGVIVKPEHGQQIVAAALGLKILLAVGIKSEGERKMGAR